MTENVEWMIQKYDEKPGTEQLFFVINEMFKKKFVEYKDTGRITNSDMINMLDELQEQHLLFCEQAELLDEKVAFQAYVMSTVPAAWALWRLSKLLG